MAVEFASSGYADFGASVPTPAQMTLAAWIYPATVSGGSRAIIGRDDNGFSSNRVFQFRRSNSVVQFVVFPPVGSPVTVSSSTTITANNWHHVAARADGATAKVYINGVERGSATFANDVAAKTRGWVVGGMHNNAAGTTYTLLWDGRIAEAAQWNAAISPGDIAALAAGVRPKFVRPDALDIYCPLWGSYTETDEVGGLVATELNKSHADHPRLLGGRRSRVILPPSAPLASRLLMLRRRMAQ